MTTQNGRFFKPKQPGRATDNQDEKPPAYVEASSPGSSASHPTNAVGPHHGVGLPAPTVPQIHVWTKNDDINGTFYIDPSAPRLHEPSKAERKLIAGAHSSFQSKHGDIRLHLGTTGPGAIASAVIANKHGDVNVNILPLLPGRPHISLDVSSHHGKVVLFIPDTFHGVLSLSTKRGDLEILPAFSQAMQTFKMTPKEVLVYFGTKNEDHVGDYCQVTTKHGGIVVGIAGRDQYGGETGLLKTLGNAISQLIR